MKGEVSARVREGKGSKGESEGVGEGKMRK